MDALLQDLRFAFRTLRKRPGFTAAAVLTLALGIGATTAVFSVVHGVLLRPLPIADQERVVMLWKNYPQNEFDRFPLTFAELHHWKEEAEVLEGVAGVQRESPLRYAWRLRPDADPERIGTAPVSHGFFSVLGVQPVLGRGFRPADGRRGAEPVVVLSHELWRSHFGGDPDIVGRLIYNSSGLPLTVVGVAPSRFDYPQGTDIWFPAVGAPANAPFFHAIGRLKPGATAEAARAEMQVLAERLTAKGSDLPRNPTVVARPFAETIIGGLRSPLLILLGAVAVVLLIACANVANLLLVRAMGRRREFAVRLSLGANRWHIVRQLLTESALLGLSGGALGVLLAWWGLDVLLALMPEGVPRADTIGMDPVVLGFAVLISLATAIGFGFVPALRARKPELTSVLKESGDQSAGSRRGRRTGRTLVAGQLALTLVLLIGAGLLIQSFVRQLQVDRGFRPENLLVALVTPSSSKYEHMAQRVAFFDQLGSRVERLPSVLASTPTLNPPAGAGGGAVSVPVVLEGQSPEEADAQNPQLNYEAVAPDYFRMLGIPLLRGRTFDPRDRQDGPKVAVVNSATAERLWPGEDPIGKRIKLGRQEISRWHTVVGVVGDVNYRAVTSSSLTAYVPIRQAFRTPNFLLVRTTADPAQLVPAVRREIHALDPDIPLDEITTMDALVSTALARPRFNSVLLGVFAAIALGLAAVGIYGVMAALVGRRTHEIGVRKALGARRGQLLRLVVGEGAVLVVIGLLVGIAAALALTRLLSGLLYGVSPTDPLTFAGVALLLSGVALLASWLPALRAARVDPMIALRNE